MSHAVSHRRLNSGKLLSCDFKIFLLGMDVNVFHRREVFPAAHGLKRFVVHACAVRTGSEFACCAGWLLQRSHQEEQRMGICRRVCRNVDSEFDTNAPYLHPNCTLNAPRAESWVHLSHFRSLSRVHLGSLGAPSRES